MLECRLLTSIIAEAPSSHELTGDDEISLLLDGSPSIKGHEYGKIAEMLDAASVDGVVGIGGFRSGPSTLRLLERGKPMEKGRAL